MIVQDINRENWFELCTILQLFSMSRIIQNTEFLKVSLETRESSEKNTSLFNKLQNHFIPYLMLKDISILHDQNNI